MLKKNKKGGFTLSETLITIAIIGVTAALTLPAFHAKLKSRTYGATVAKAMNVIQNGMGQIMTDASNRSDEGYIYDNISAITAKSVSGSGDDTRPIITNPNLCQTYVKYFDRIKPAGYAYKNITDFSGTKSYESIFSEKVQAQSYNINNSSAVITYLSTTHVNNSEPNDELTKYVKTNGINDGTVIVRILIDANGLNGPNRFGKDVFLFGLANNGTLVPAGTDAFNDNIFNKTVPLYTTDCTGKTVTGDGVSCAARLVADNWKVNYKK